MWSIVIKKNNDGQENEKEDSRPSHTWRGTIFVFHMLLTNFKEKTVIFQSILYYYRNMSTRMRHGLKSKIEIETDNWVDFCKLQVAWGLEDRNWAFL